MERHITVTAVEEVVCLMITTVFGVVKMNIAFANFPKLCELQTKNGLNMGGGVYKNHGFWDQIIAGMAAMYTLEHTEKILRCAGNAGLWYAGDGGGTVDNREVEMAWVGYFDKAESKAKFDWFSVDEVNLAASENGDSPDAKAIFATQLSSFQRRFGEDEEQTKMILAKSMVSLSFDGAAVNMGDKNSVATRWLEVAPQAIIFHAVSHRLQNAWTDACGEVPYIFHVSECISDCFSLMNASMKKDAGFRDMAAVLQVSVVTLKSIHGIRWLASNARATGALLRDWLPLVAYFEKVALEKAKVLPSTAPSAKFIGAKMLIANGNGTPKPGRVVNVLKGASCPSGSAGRVSEEMGYQFTVVLDKKTGKSPKV